jgi:hypothetical protein
LTFSDLQADIAADLIRRGLNLHAFNQRSVAGILDMIRMVGAMVGASDRAEQLVGALEARLAEARDRAECLPKRPRVFFEEWDDPLISGIGWVSELVAIAGGIDIFADRAKREAGKDRVVTIDEVVAREPDFSSPLFEPPGKLRQIDDGPGVRAEADFLSTLGRSDRELDLATVDLCYFRLARNPAASRRCSDVTDVDRLADRAFARVEIGPDGVERGVFHDHDHDRSG